LNVGKIAVGKFQRIHVSEYYGIQNGLMGIYITDTCNLSCRHCSTDSGPLKKTFLVINHTVIESIRSAIEKTDIKALHVSGGEPFLRQNELRLLGQLADAANIQMAINTNGYWAKSVATGAKLLKSMVGVTELILSTDIYHVEYLSTERMIMAALAGLESEMLVNIVTTTPEARRTEFTDKLDARLDQLGIFDKVRRLHQELCPTAREKPIPDAVAHFLSPELPMGACNLLNRSTIIENGMVLACCNTPIAKQCSGSPLNLGNINDTSLSVIIERKKADRVIQGLRLLGPAVLARSLEPEEFSLLPKAYPANDICALCTAMMGRSAITTDIAYQLTTGKLKNLLDAAIMLSPD
jgi:hypothetical protein